MKIEVTIRTTINGSDCVDEIEIDDGELVACETEQERDELIELYAKEAAFQHIDWFWKEI